VRPSMPSSRSAAGSPTGGWLHADGPVGVHRHPRHRRVRDRIQLVIGALFVLVLALLRRHPAPLGQYLTTGSFVVCLITVAMVAAPQIIAAQKMSQQYEYRWSLRSLAAPRRSHGSRSRSRSAFRARSWRSCRPIRYGVTYDVSAMIVPAVFAGLLTAGLIGYAMAHTLKPCRQLTATAPVRGPGVRPINFPPENLPVGSPRRTCGCPSTRRRSSSARPCSRGGGNVAQSTRARAWAIGCGAAVIWAIGRGSDGPFAVASAMLWQWQLFLLRILHFKTPIGRSRE